MRTFFIRTKDQEGFIEAVSLKEAFVVFVKQTPLEQLGLILIGHSEFFVNGELPDESIAVRVTIPLVEAGIWTEEKAKDFNEELIGKRII